MPIGSRIANLILLPALALTLNAETLAAEYPGLPEILPSQACFQYANANLWGYLRMGLTYLESPQPFAYPEAVPPSYVHPDARGFGAYGLSPEAYEDVQNAYPDFKKYNWQEILKSQQLYELASRAFADLLLKHLREYIPDGAGQEQIFDIIHKAWNLGLTGFKNGGQTVASRMKRAEEFKADWEINRWTSNLSE
ncbi:MAG: hypothetical protein PHW98_04795 [Candidatus Omnitrophica bacterium]|nr:hypothetical protein [Candidatus Omnitrophota bacterium]